MATNKDTGGQRQTTRRTEETEEDQAAVDRGGQGAAREALRRRGRDPRRDRRGARGERRGVRPLLRPEGRPVATACRAVRGRRKTPAYGGSAFTSERTVVSAQGHQTGQRLGRAGRRRVDGSFRRHGLGQAGGLHDGADPVVHALPRLVRPGPAARRTSLAGRAARRRGAPTSSRTCRTPRRSWPRRCERGVVMAGDRRATAGNMISKRDVEKVFRSDEFSAIGDRGRGERSGWSSSGCSRSSSSTTRRWRAGRSPSRARRTGWPRWSGTT